MEQRSVSRETLAVQALGEADPVSGGLAPVISPATKGRPRTRWSGRLVPPASGSAW